MKKCWYYDPTMTLEENKKAAEQKIKEKQAAKREKTKEAAEKQEAVKTTAKCIRELLYSCLLKRRQVCA